MFVAMFFFGIYGAYADNIFSAYRVKCDMDQESCDIMTKGLSDIIGSCNIDSLPNVNAGYCLRKDTQKKTDIIKKYLHNRETFKQKEHNLYCSEEFINFENEQFSLRCSTVGVMVNTFISKYGKYDNDTYNEILSINLKNNNYFKLTPNIILIGYYGKQELYMTRSSLSW
jgi:hypothetical protein